MVYIERSEVKRGMVVQGVIQERQCDIEGQWGCNGVVKTSGSEQRGGTG